MNRIEKLTTLLLACIFYFSGNGAVKDSLKKHNYHLRFSVGAGLNQSNFNIEENSNYESHSGLISYYKSASYNSKYTTKLSPGINLNCDLVFAAGIKVCAGFFYNRIKIVTTDIAYTEHENVTYVHGSQSNPTYDSTKVYYTGTDYFKDNITISYYGFAAGIGYSKKIKKFILDFDAKVRVSPALKTVIDRTYISQATMNADGKTHFDTKLWGPFQDSHPKTDIGGLFSYSPSLNLAVNYQLWKLLYANIGINYTMITDYLESDPKNFEYPENVSIKLRTFNQISLYGGLMLVIK